MIERVYGGKEFRFMGTKTAPVLIAEIFADNYEVFRKGLEFRDGDVIIDAGANEGVFSVLMAKMFPTTRVIALEPVPATFETLQQNMAMNGCKNIEARNVGLGPPGRRKVEMIVSNEFSGGSTLHCTFDPKTQHKESVGLVTLAEVFEQYGVERCRLLKVDIEGSEYDVLYKSADLLPLVENIVIEIHINRRLEFEGRRADGLATWLADQTHLLHVDIIKMAE